MKSPMIIISIAIICTSCSSINYDEKSLIIGEWQIDSTNLGGVSGIMKLAINDTTKVDRIDLNFQIKISNNHQYELKRKMSSSLTGEYELVEDSLILFDEIGKYSLYFNLDSIKEEYMFLSRGPTNLKLVAEDTIIFLTAHNPKWKLIRK